MAMDLLGPDAQLQIQARGDPPVTIRNYFEETIPAYTDLQFYQHFRMNREAFTVKISIALGIAI